MTNDNAIYRVITSSVSAKRRSAMGTKQWFVDAARALFYRYGTMRRADALAVPPAPVEAGAAMTLHIRRRRQHTHPPSQPTFVYNGAPVVWHCEVVIINETRLRLSAIFVLLLFFSISELSP